MLPPPERPNRLTLSDIELWCQAMRATEGCRDDAPVRGTLTWGGWLKGIKAFPHTDGGPVS